jgi:hypothetical protein
MGTSYNPKIVTDGLVLNLDPANVKSYPANQDPFVNNVSLMLSMDGANNSTTFIDSSQNALAITALADAKISTAQSKFGGSAAYLDGTGDYLTVANNAVNAFGLGDFTIECWVNFSALPGTNLNMGIANVMTSASSATTTMWWLGLYNNAGTTRLQLGRHGNGSVFAYTNWTPSLNTWYHIAATRSSSSVISMFIDGVSQSVTTSGSNWANNFSATTILSVGYVATALTFNGYIDDFRLTRAARYTASFTPPTAPLSLPGVVTDLTKNRVVGTLTNGPTYSASAITTDGVDDYINCGNYANANFGTSNFTINMWIKTTSTTGGTILAKSTGDSANVSYGWLIYLNATSSGEIGFGTATAAGAFSTSGNYIIRTSGASVNNGAWKMVTVVADRSLANVSIYINGVLQTLTTWISATASLATVGNITNSQVLCIGNESDFNVPANATFSLVQLYNKALTLNEIRQNFNATKGRFGL